MYQICLTLSQLQESHAQLTQHFSEYNKFVRHFLNCKKGQLEMTVHFGIRSMTAGITIYWFLCDVHKKQFSKSCVSWEWQLRRGYMNSYICNSKMCLSWEWQLRRGYMSSCICKKRSEDYDDEMYDSCMPACVEKVRRWWWWLFFQKLDHIALIF